MHRVFQRIGQNRAEGNLRAGKVFTNGNIADKLHGFQGKTSLVDGNNRVDHIVFTVSGNNRFVIGIVDPPDIVHGLVGIAILKLGQKDIQMMAHIMPQDGKCLFGEMHLFYLILEGGQLHFHKSIILADLLFFLIFPEIDQKKHYI